MIILYEVAAYVYKGTREKNDDRVAICQKIISSGTFSEKYNKLMVSVFDGVGGQAHGDAAAQAAAEAFISEYSNGFDVSSNYSEQLIKKSYDAVMNVRATDNEHCNAATTIAGILLSEKAVVYFNWGDSKIFLCRNSIIKQISKDHTLLQQMLDIGVKCPPLSSKSPLTGYLGCPLNKSDKPMIYVDSVQENDIWIICTDGLSDFLSINLMLEILNLDCSLIDKCRKMVDDSINNGSNDNISVILIKGE